MIFRNPLLLALLIIVPFLVYIKITGARGARGAIRYSNIAFCKEAQPTWKVYWFKSMPWLILTAFVLMIIALARPQLGVKESIVRRQGIDIVLTLDSSTSMLAEDFKTETGRTNRLEVVKEVTRNFINGRPNDRIGIVTFAGRPYILSPLTWDHDWSEARLEEVKTGTIEDGTAIGSALTTAIGRLHDSNAKSKVIILLTDGMNNAGQIMPETAAEAAKTLKITIYTIGAGSNGYVPYPMQDSFGRTVYQNVKIDIDEALLQKIASITGGKYFRATNAQSLKEIFSRINKMEKSVIEAPNYREYIELYPYFLIPAFILLLAEAILSTTILRRLP